jgi:hypothetical protein
MADRLVVQITGKIGLSWADDLRVMLKDATGLSWEQDPERERLETGDAQGVDTIILVAALTSTVDIAVKALMHQAHEALAEWRKKRLDSPAIDVVHEGDDPEADPKGDPEADPEADAEPDAAGG